MGGVIDWIDVARDRDKRRSLVNTVGSLRVAWNAGNFMVSWSSSSFWRRTSRMELFIVGCSLTSTGMRQARVVELFVLSSVFYNPVRSWTLFGVTVCVCMGRDSAVCIATRYELDGPGIESWWGARFSAPVQAGPGTYPASYTMGTGSFPGDKAAGAWRWPPTLF